MVKKFLVLVYKSYRYFTKDFPINNCAKIFAETKNAGTKNYQ